MPGHAIGHGSRVEGALRVRQGARTTRFVSQGEKLPGQRVDDDFLSAQLRQRRIGIQADSHDHLPSHR